MPHQVTFKKRPLIKSYGQQLCSARLRYHAWTFKGSLAARNKRVKEMIVTRGSRMRRNKGLLGAEETQGKSDRSGSL